MESAIIQTPQERKLVLSMMLTSLLPLLDSSIINVILPDILKDIVTSHAHIQWAVTAYMLSCSAGILLSPVLNKKYDIKTAWICAMLIFLLGSILTGAAFNMISLITSRCIQGVGAGILLPLSQSVLAIQFGKERLKSVMALIAIPAVFAPSAGPVLGAVLAESINWRVVFFINVPIIFIAIFSGITAIPQVKKTNEKTNHLVFFLFFSSLTFIFIGLDDFFTESETVFNHKILLFLGLPLLIAAIVVNNQSPTQIVNLRLFKERHYALAILMNFFTSIIFFGFLIFFPMVKAGQDNSPALYIGVLLALQGVGAWLARYFIYPGLINYNSFLTASIGILISAASIMIIEKNGVFFECAGFMIRGAGLGIATIVTLSAPFEFTEKEYIYDTSAITRVTQQTGGAFGGLLAGALIYFTGKELIPLHSAYYILFWISLISGVIPIVSLFFGKKTAHQK